MSTYYRPERTASDRLQKFDCGWQWDILCLLLASFSFLILVFPRSSRRLQLRLAADRDIIPLHAESLLMVGSIEFGVSVLVLSIIVCFVFVVRHYARLLSRRDAARRKVREEQVLGFAKLTRDMSEQKKANDMIRCQARLIEDISDAIISTDPEIRIVSWNKAAEKLYGYSQVEALGQDLGDLLRSSVAPLISQAIREQLHELGYWHGEQVYFTNKNASLNVLVSISAILDERNTTTGYAIVCRDITERQKAEQRLIKFNRELSRQVEEKTAEVREIFERVSDAFMAYDASGTIVYISSRAKEMISKAGLAVGINAFRELPVSVNDPFGRHFRRAMETQQDQHYEYFSEILNIWLESHMYPSANGISMFFRDITEDKRVREQLSESNVELRALASHLQNVREEERADMAREIHDELGQQLTGLKMDMAWLDEQLAAADRPLLRQRVSDTLQLLDHTIMTVRKIAAELRPGILDDLGLVAAVEWQAEEFEKRSGIKSRFQAGMASRRYPAAMSIGLFRICQEALSNVGRHSGAKKVEIFLGYYEDRILLRVEDDGKGLVPAGSSSKRATLGLLGMKERALMMGGTLDICSEAGKGLTLTVSVPVSISENT
jgi:PAS domain S-box-containing protein